MVYGEARSCSGDDCLRHIYGEFCILLPCDIRSRAPNESALLHARILWSIPLCLKFVVSTSYGSTDTLPILPGNESEAVDPSNIVRAHIGMRLLGYVNRLGRLKYEQTAR